MSQSRKVELAVFFEKELPLLRCHHWNPTLSTCSCGYVDCPTPGKHPKENRGVYDAKAYKSARELGNCNVALATGHGVVVLDIDPRNGGDKTLAELEMTHGQLPQTWRTFTGGGGFHYFFSAPEGTRSNKRLTRSGVELQGLGGYVMLPTSFHQSGRFYEWDTAPYDEGIELAPLPEWLMYLGGADNYESGEAADGQLRLYGYDDIEDILALISSDCDRVTWRNVGWSLRDAGVPFEKFDSWSSNSKKYKGSKDCATLWKSYRPDGGIHAGTLFGIARSLGWTPREKKSLLIVDDEPTIETKFDQGEEAPPPIIEEEEGPPPLLEEEEAKEAAKIAPAPAPAPTQPEIIISLSEEVSFDPVTSCPEWPPGMVGIIAERVYETAPQQHKQFAIATALSMVSSAATMNYVTPIQNGSIASYMVLVATAAVGKEHYRGRHEKVIKVISPARPMAEPLSSQALRFQWIECNARSFNCDEILKWFSMIYDPRNPNGNKIVSDVLKVWGLGTESLEGYATKKADDATPTVHLPALTIFGCGTHQRFRDLCKNSDFAHDGLLSRIDAIFATHSSDSTHTPLDTIPFMIPKSVRLRLEEVAKKPVDGTFQVNFHTVGGGKKDATFRDIKIFSERTRVDWADDSVPTAWRAIFHECKKRTGESKNEPIDESLWSRCAEKVVRTASLLAVMADPVNPQITLEHLQWSWRWHQYVVNGMRSEIGVSKGSVAENLRALIRKAVSKVAAEKQKGAVKDWSTVTLREMIRAERTINQSDFRAIQDATSYLEAEGFLSVLQEHKDRRTKLRVRYLGES